MFSFFPLPLPSPFSLSLSLSVSFSVSPSSSSSSLFTFFLHHRHHDNHQFSHILSVFSEFFALIDPIFVNFHAVLMYVSHIFTLHMDPKTLKKKGLIKKRFPISGHFGRFWSPKSDLSVGQAGANCETFWRVKCMFTIRHIIPHAIFWMK